MRLLISNQCHIAKLPFRHINCKYAFQLFSKNYSTSVAGEKIESDNKLPEFIERRISLWEKLKIEYDDILQSKKSEPIKITNHYGQVFEGYSWQSTPNQLFKVINKNALKQAIVAKVNNELWDLNRPLEGDCRIELLEFDNPLAKHVLWHSSAHVLGSALESYYGCLLNTGPATNNGFFYDIDNNNKEVSCEY